ncbi:hypothetical protein FOCC_FOCC001733 [Frankliniella occidentalis]|uniref:Zinc finger MYM-type protein 4 n=1 Tax=Frankliniella occidentalis TaxID=133901 RepID=A0A6J1SUP3_FRAOC|nr:zinc finger MYM-type protein 4 [Frankliniella occidentalis]XP_026284599.2 zinc finger MYM-type protein 4 [Frankliniella occidentalis]XP_026284600.2 zinc finger MYM-type protein 4 [Frankliniella occidentalis]KAE8751487.1 hypothetical protein FOCC_FOCC001733 [Frankliniella occidentalis]
MDCAVNKETTADCSTPDLKHDEPEKQTLDSKLGPSEQKNSESDQASPLGEDFVSKQDPDESQQKTSNLLQSTNEELSISSRHSSNNVVVNLLEGNSLKPVAIEQNLEVPKTVLDNDSKKDDNIAILPPQDEESASHKTSKSHYSGDISKTDKETEPTLQIVQTVSLNTKCSKELVSDSETNAAVNSILEQPASENEETLVTTEGSSRIELKDKTISTNEDTSVIHSNDEEHVEKNNSDGPKEISNISMEEEDEIRVLSVDAPSKKTENELFPITKDLELTVVESVCKDNSDIALNADVNKSTGTPATGDLKTVVESSSSMSMKSSDIDHKSTENKLPEPRVTETGNKSTTADGEEELCIVPDTEPRVPTEQEKANAFEKANKSSGLAEEVAEINEKDKCSSTLASDVPRSNEKCNETEDKIEEETDSGIGSVPKARKFGIQLVSTSSLVSRQALAEKEQQDQTDALLCSTAPDDMQTEEGGEHTCAVCGKLKKCKYHLQLKKIHLCEDACYTSYRKANDPPPVPQPPKATIRPRKLDRTYVHKCGQCLKKVDMKLEKTLTWETMDFCSEDCLEKYQKSFGSHCANCKKPVQSASLGKYCVRFGYDMKQFCDARCLEEFKKGLKVCSYCQKDISADTEGFLAPVGDKGQFKDFCSQECMEKYDQMSHNTVAPEITYECAVCNNSKPVKVEVLIDSKVQKLCSEPCFAAFKFANGIVADQCDMCKKYYDHNRSENFTVYYDEAPHSFCCKTCMNVYILAKRKIVPCSHCKVKKYNFDMIKKTTLNGQVVLMMCSLYCLNLYGLSSSMMIHSVPKKTGCEFCSSSSPAQFHLTMSDASVRSFCSSNCVVSFQGKYQNKAEKTPYPLGAPRKIFSKKISANVDDKDHGSNILGSMPVISSVTSLAPASGSVPPLSASSSSSSTVKNTATETIVKTVYKQHYIVRPPVHPEMTNCAVQVKPKTASKEVSCQPDTCTVGTQTDDSMSKPLFIPVPIPIFIPAPMQMYTSPYPIPVPIALPIPVPIFIPTTRNSSKGILKEIKRIQEKIPSDPYEAELLMMAEMVANDKKVETTDSESDDGENKAPDVEATDSGTAAEADFSPENGTNNTFGNEVLQMALKMVSEYDEPAVDFETSRASDSVSQTPSKPANEDKKDSERDDEEDIERKTKSSRKRSLRQSSDNLQSVKSKRSRKSSVSDPATTPIKTEPNIDLIVPKTEPVEKPDAHMCLKFTLGANAWKSWVTHKNEELVKTGGASKNVKLLKEDILQLTADELNYSLCLFVKEALNPNGQEYTPDTLYYLCLGIQQYLVENGRIENIFSDPYYEKFTTCLDDVVKKFADFNIDTNILVTRIKEEHLWESKQLGAHSPYVLLSTLMYFNTKHFNLMSVEEHMQLSFSHIMKHWKRPPNVVGPHKPGSLRHVVLRFYPPQSALAANSKKKKVYEQQEDEENPLRCPVKLYEFYLSKCPESVKTRNDVFYLLPERSCVPDSPVWYSTMALGQEQLHKMLNRIRLVKEIVML